MDISSLDHQRKQNAKVHMHGVPNVQLRQQRNRRNWTQTEMARRLGTTYLSVCRWENGTTLPSLHFRKQLCELFDLPPEELGLAPPAEETVRETQGLPLTSTVWTVPYRRNPFFTGREHILIGLHTLLRAGKRAALVQVQAISGLGGIGKTQTAIEYAYRFREYYQAVLWCRAETRNALLADLAALAEVLDLPEKDEQEQERVVQAVRRWLQRSTGWLLILDNVEELSLVEDALPAEYSGHVLITTRAQALGPFAQRIDLERMGPAEGALCLLRRAKLIAPDAPLEENAAVAQAKELSTLLDGLPLALDQAGAYIEETDCSLSDYLQRYQSRGLSLLQRRGGLGTDHPEPVGTTVSLALGKVERLNPVAAELLRLCAFLDPDAIPEEIMTAGAADLGPVLGPAGADPVALDDAIADLRRYSLLRRNPESKVLTIHRLVQVVLKDSVSEPSQREWAERCVRAVNRTFPVGEFVNWQQCQRFLPQALACVAFVAQWGLDFVEAAQLQERAGNYLVQRGQFQAAEPLLKDALALYEQILGAEDLTVAIILNDLAGLYYHQGKYGQAAALLQRALEIREQSLGPTHVDVAVSLNDLGLVYHNQGKYALAESLMTRAIAILKQKPESKLASLASSLTNLSSLYCDQGYYAQAEVALEEASMLWQQALDPDHPDIAFAFGNLAFLYYKQGRYAEAEPLVQRALEIREQTLGAEHIDVAYTLNCQALIQCAQGNYTQAEFLFRRMLAICEQSLGAEHANVAQSLTQLALLYYAQDKYKEAEPLLTRAVAMCEKALGPDHPDLAQSLNALALIYLAQERYAEAEPLAQRALSICKQRLGAEHPDTADDLNTLGMLYGQQGEYGQAELCLQQALSICEQRLGAMHPSTARSLHELARLYTLQGRSAEAEPLLQRALQIRQQSLGATHPATVATRKRYASLLRELKQDRGSSG